MAWFKCTEFSGNKILVLAAGLGIDDWAFSHSFKEVISIDTDEDINDISRYNFQKAGIHNIKRVNAKAEEFVINDTNEYDLIYIDPDRRTEKGRQILLSEHQPNIIELLPELFQKSKKVLIKCSPLYDYEMAKKELPHLSKMFSISRNSEMKELLLLVDSENESSNLEIICCDLNKNGQTQIYKTFEDLNIHLKNLEDHIGKYLYEAASCLVKMRVQSKYAFELDLKPLHYLVPYFTSDILNENFIGRCFTIIQSMSYNVKNCLKYLKENQINKANIKARGVKFNTEDVKKKLKLGDGGNDYIFVLPFKNDTILIHCRY